MKLVLLVVSTILALTMSLACSGGSETGQTDQGGPIPTYYEKCTPCGMQWSVSILDASPERTVVEVVVENSGERGDIELQFDELVGFALDARQAESWRQLYPAARKAGTLFSRLQEAKFTALYLRPIDARQLPATVKAGRSWAGRFETIDHGIPGNSAGVILAFGPVSYQQATGSQPKTEHWLTWDSNRPFIGIASEVRVTPAAVTGAP
jgi:hypothetical protein